MSRNQENAKFTFWESKGSNSEVLMTGLNKNTLHTELKVKTWPYVLCMYKKVYI